MLFWTTILFPVSIYFTYCFIIASGSHLPIELGGAIIAAVEHDAEQEEQQRELMEINRAKEQFWRILNGDIDAIELEQILNELHDFGDSIGRSKYYKGKKMLKMLYPLLVGVFIAKTVLIPMLLKLLTALSTSSFVMAKIALITSGLLALKWIFSDSNLSSERLKIIHVPATSIKSYSAGNANGDWSDLYSSGSDSWFNMKELQQQQQPQQQHHQQKYISLGGAATINGGGNAVGGGYGKDAMSYHYPQHNYENVYDAKPFL